MSKQSGTPRGKRSGRSRKYVYFAREDIVLGNDGILRAGRPVLPTHMFIKGGPGYSMRQGQREGAYEFHVLHKDLGVDGLGFAPIYTIPFSMLKRVAVPWDRYLEIIREFDRDRDWSFAIIKRWKESGYKWFPNLPIPEVVP
jgi:hypothetical protein